MGNIYQIFEQSFKEHPERDCLVVDGQHYSYEKLSQKVGRIAWHLNTSNSFVGIMAHRSVVAYTSVLAILKSGKAYVPLNPKFPMKRNLQIAELSSLDTLIVGEECMDSLKELLRHSEQVFKLIFPEMERADISLDESLEKHAIISKEDLQDFLTEGKEVLADSYAYMLFTSGSTGLPKGVPVSHANVNAYIEYLGNRYEVSEEDRFSQTFDLTFDLSVHDMFLCWYAGASLYCIPERQLLAPAKFIKTHQISMWFSVPSLGQFMKRFRMLKANAFPALKYSLFCGEPLPLSLVEQWQGAAPNSHIENIYGPTEATIGITHYRVPVESEQIKSHNGIVSIGKIFDTQTCCIVDDTDGPLTDSAVNVEGELCLSGTQLTTGYWQNLSKTTQQFVNLNEKEGIWYKTGDIVKKDADGDIFYVARKDFQVKIRGYRIELDEINHHISQFTDTDLVFSMPYPLNDGIAESIYTFIDHKCEKPKTEIIEYLNTVLPSYMIPKDIVYIEKFPLNANGKIDKRGLMKALTEKKYA